VVLQRQVRQLKLEPGDRVLLAALSRLLPRERWGSSDGGKEVITNVTCLWHGSLHTRTVRVILLRDEDTDTGYDLALVTTDLTTTAANLISRYASRWSIEVGFAEARDLLGGVGTLIDTGVTQVGHNAGVEEVACGLDQCIDR
jgi:hypothetical protein